MYCVNRVTLVGNVGRDPEIRYTADGSIVVNLSIATSFSRKDKNTGAQIEQTEWHRVVCFGKLAEICSESVKKGNKIYIEGYLKTNKWVDKSGENRYTTEIVGNYMLRGGAKEQSADIGETENQTSLRPSLVKITDMEDYVPF